MGIVRVKNIIERKSPFFGAFSIGSKILNFLVLLLIILELYLAVPWLGGGHLSSKIFSFIFISFVFSFISINLYRHIYFSSVTVSYFILLIFLTVSSLFSYDSFNSFLTIGFLLTGSVFHALLTDFLHKNPISYRNIFNCILILGTVAAALGLYEFFSYKLIGPSTSMLIPYLLPPDISPRVGGMFGQPNLFSAFLQVVLVVFFFRHLHTDFSSNHIRFMHYLPFWLVSLVFFLTGSRGGLISFCIVLGILSWLVARKVYLDNDTKKKRRFLVLLSTIFFAFFAAKFLTVGDISEGSRTLSALGINSEARYIFWTSAILMFLDTPFWGQGLSSFGLLQNSYNPIAYKFLGFVQLEAMGNTNWAHNELLQLLAEGGIFAFLFFFSLLLLYLSKLKLASRALEYNPQNFYSFILLLPFILQSMLSWTFRNPPLFVLFFIIVSILLSQNSLKSIRIGTTAKVVGNFFLLVGLVISLFFLTEDIRIKTFSNKVQASHSLTACFADFSSLAESKYASYRVVSRYTPQFIAEAMRNNDIVLARKIMPYAKWLTKIEGTGVQWYHLAQLYLFLEDQLNSEVAITSAIDMLPHDNRLWGFLHYLNMLKAVESTGKTLEHFLPIPPGGNASEVKGLFDFDDNFKLSK